MLDLLALLLCVGCELPALPIAGADAGQVDVELVLAVDVSSSMDNDEFALQRAGYVEALRHPDFVKAVLSGMRGRIALTYFEWAGTVHEDSVIPWQIIDGPDSANDFAAKLALRPLGGFGATAISSAVTFGASLFERNAVKGEKRVIDISGDGPNNSGMPVAPARDAVVSSGIVINGLPILIRPSRSFEDLDLYYAECVTGGPGSFVLPIHVVSEFATAIRRKLILEVSGPIDAPEMVKANAVEPFDCLVGEHFRLIYPDL
jgi:hypothetical protein